MDCQISSYCCRNTRSSARTVLFSVSKKMVVFWSCFFSTLEKASLRIRDCSSMYFRDRVEFASSSCNLRETALKKLSWMVGRDGAADVAVVLFFCEVTVCLIDADAATDDIDSCASEVVLATLELPVVFEDISDDEELSLDVTAVRREGSEVVTEINEAFDVSEASGGVMVELSMILACAVAASGEGTAGPSTIKQVSGSWMDSKASKRSTRLGFCHGEVRFCEDASSMKLFLLVEFAVLSRSSAAA